MVSFGTNDELRHHVLLTGDGTGQSLYLDSNLVGLEPKQYQTPCPPSRCRVKRERFPRSTASRAALAT